MILNRNELLPGFPRAGFPLSRWTCAHQCETVVVVFVEIGEALLAEAAYSGSGVQDGEYDERHWTHRMVGRDWRLRGAFCCVCTVAAASMRQRKS